jgi:anti-sigma regulatory factor (Ser/Thr protein kinase)/uncharacterized protein (DUF1330 family)
MKQTEEIRSFVIAEIGKHPKDIVNLVAETFSISRQAAHRHVDKMVKENVIFAQGTTKNRTYRIANLVDKSWQFAINGLKEDEVWRKSVSSQLKELTGNILNICQYGFTEMVNNTIDHSEGTTLTVHVIQTPGSISITIQDDGIGIFNKIQRELELDDNLHAILELSKGKLTTNPEKHSGEGIFFTSRMFDRFSILSGDLFFTTSSSGDDDTSDWLLEHKGMAFDGTEVSMTISTNSKRTTRQVFDRYSVDGDYGFSKTTVPVFLAQYGGENLISRSQAKRLLARFERFKEIVLDFKSVEMIGQAFADEVFRVYQNAHPQTHFSTINTNEEISQMIAHVTA